MLGYQNAYSNSNNQLWIFWESNINCVIKEEDEQHISCEVDVQSSIILITHIYAKCDANLRIDLWNKLRGISANYDLLWMVCRDFNYIVDPIEKKEGTSHRMSKSLDSIHCIMDCDLIDAGYSGSPFTWCNGWAPDRRVWQRLDRVLTNYKWANLFDSTYINHLIKIVAEHSPFLITTSNNTRDHIK